MFVQLGIDLMRHGFQCTDALTDYVELLVLLPHHGGLLLHRGLEKLSVRAVDLILQFAVLGRSMIERYSRWAVVEQWLKNGKQTKR